MWASDAREHGVEPPLQARLVEVFARITLPPVADRSPLPVALGWSSGEPFVPPLSLRRQYCRAARTPLSGVATKLPVPVALAYWTDQPVIEIGDVLRLNSSMKSFWYGAPVLPPPP